MAGSLESSPVSEHPPIHLRPTAELAERALLPGDPGRALALAQALLEKPLMFNHHRGLWGYTGIAADGQPLTIQSTGMGGPSAAIVLHELIALGVRRAIRVGTCGALDGALALGELIVVGEAIAADGTSRALGAGPRVAGDGALTAALARATSRERAAALKPPGSTDTAAPKSAAAPGRDTTPVETTTVVSTDLFYDPDERRQSEWLAAGAVAVEMEAATLFALGTRAGVPVGCVLTVSDALAANGTRTRIDDDTLLTVAHRMGRAAVDALPADAHKMGRAAVQALPADV
jgi:uridine phosphorylase